MDEQQFWKIVEQADGDSQGDMARKCEAVRTAVALLPAESAIAFSRIFDLAMNRAYSWSLWGAAYVINGGCSDDTFSDFRSALVSRGRQAFEAALVDPDSLASEDFDADNWFFEGYQYAVADGVKAAAGSVPNRETPHPASPSGREWSEDEVYALFPRLTEMFT